MATIFTNGKFQAFDSNGDPLVGGKLYTYTAGTTTNKTTYSDPGLTTPNTNPVVLDARGEASVWWGTGSIRMTLKTSADVTIWDQDNIPPTQEAVGTAYIKTLLDDTTAAEARTTLDVISSSESLAQAKRRGVSVKDAPYSAVGDGTTDDTAAIQAALDAGVGPIYFPPGVYVVSSEIVVPDGSGIIGAGAFWKRRTGYPYSGDDQTVFKYTGAGGSNSCVVRLSEKAVGTEGTDFNAGDGLTDDLISIVATDFHVDANNLAEIGVYVYRAGNQSTLRNITAEKARKYNHVHLGCYAAEFGTFGAYECEEHGVAVGWDIFGWGSVEASCFAYRAKFLTANNGTAGTYVAGGANDLDGSGGKFSVGRGSEVFITSESNDGRACILSQYNSANATMGTTDYVLEYIEGNADGPYVDYRDAMDSIRLMNGFLHPGNGSNLLPQGIKIDGKNNSGVTTSGSGPTRMEEWLTLYRLFGDLSGVGVAIDSNTSKYRIIECTPYFTFASQRPGAYGFNLSIEGATTPGAQTYTLRSGYATRYGNLVVVHGRVTLSALDGTTAGQVRITGLPYRIASLTNLFGTATITAWSGLTTSVVALSGQLSGGTSYIALTKLTAAGTSSLTNLVPADLSNTTLLQFTATYITDDA